MDITNKENQFLERAYELALEAERNGNLAVGALIVYNNDIVSEGKNCVLTPVFNPLSHAEINALHSLPHEFHKVANDLTLYTSMEPCVMCTSTIVVTHIGRVVFGSTDHGLGGQALITGTLQEMYSHRALP